MTDFKWGHTRPMHVPTVGAEAARVVEEWGDVSLVGYVGLGLSPDAIEDIADPGVAAALKALSVKVSGTEPEAEWQEGLQLWILWFKVPGINKTRALTKLVHDIILHVQPLGITYSFVNSDDEFDFDTTTQA